MPLVSSSVETQERSVPDTALWRFGQNADFGEDLGSTVWGSIYQHPPPQTIKNLVFPSNTYMKTFVFFMGFEGHWYGGPRRVVFGIPRLRVRFRSLQRLIIGDHPGTSWEGFPIGGPFFLATQNPTGQ